MLCWYVCGRGKTVYCVVVVCVMLCYWLVLVYLNKLLTINLMVLDGEDSILQSGIN